MFKRLFISGLAFVVPVVITVYVIYMLFSFVDNILGSLVKSFLVDYLGYNIPHILNITIGIVLTVLVLVVLGALVQLTKKKLVQFLERVFFSWPLVEKVYFPIKKIANFLFFRTQKSFKSVVLLEYPRKGIYTIGFITNEGSEHLSEKIGKKIYNVFISSSPSPLTGFTVVVRESELIFLDITVEEALQFIVSGGLLNPEK
ncbi:MAG: DUF502 domain-containing protein [Candidatus Omnitrophica bacterium]|nr:DUF502 domain-containing protein [Candidatus Omnitrophota bacterium]MDD5081576.1 DUF502 domain-containing protein [Candidatus Omnitrophota bacterium]MDD5441308.1 DUF502 domain-containing protein [Candidatus Omnitrophota bacterium]